MWRAEAEPLAEHYGPTSVAGHIVALLNALDLADPDPHADGD